MRGPWIALYAALMLVCSWPPASADYYDGLRAFDAKNYRSAFTEWKATADEGEAKSQYRLGKLYEDGRGVPQDYINAHLYYNLAAAQGDEEAREARDSLAEKMAKEELATARTLAAAWEPVARTVAAPETVETPAQAEVPPTQDPFALFEAADLGDAQRVEELLAGGMDAGIADAQGQTPLMYAAGNGHVEVVNLLLEAGADPDAVAQDGSTALLAATLGNQPAVIAALVEAGVDVNAANKEGLTPLLAALLSKRPEAASALIDGGAEVDAKLGDGTTALMLAIISGQKETTQALLEMGADVNATNEEGVTALMAAARTADAALVSALLERGADAAHKNAADQTALDIADQGQDATTAELLLAEMPDRLMAAVERGLAEAVQRQIARGAKVNKAADNGWSPLMLASAKGNLQIALLLLAAEADVNHANKDGVTALMAAALGGHTEIVKALMQAGADPQKKNKAGLTARAVAKEKGNDEIGDLLGPSKEQIAEAQRLLARLGHDPGPVDGVMGKRTTNAIRAYQKNSQLPEDGAVTKTLLASLATAIKIRAQQKRKYAHAGQCIAPVIANQEREFYRLANQEVDYEPSQKWLSLLNTMRQLCTNADAMDVYDQLSAIDRFGYCHKKDYDFRSKPAIEVKKWAAGDNAAQRSLRSGDTESTRLFEATYGVSFSHAKKFFCSKQWKKYELFKLVLYSKVLHFPKFFEFQSIEEFNRAVPDRDIVDFNIASSDLSTVFWNTTHWSKGPAIDKWVLKTSEYQIFKTLIRSELIQNPYYGFVKCAFLSKAKEEQILELRGYQCAARSLSSPSDIDAYLDQGRPVVATFRQPDLERPACATITESAYRSSNSQKLYSVIADDGRRQELSLTDAQGTLLTDRLAVWSCRKVKEPSPQQSDIYDYR